MQVVDLLRHPSGLTYAFQERTNVDAAYRKLGVGLFGYKQITLEQMVEQLAALQLEFSPGGNGLVSTMGDYCRFCRMLMQGGILDGVRLLSPKTIQFMTANHLPNGHDLPSMSPALFSEPEFLGTGFGLGFTTRIGLTEAMVPGTWGDYSWGGAALTYFRIDPREELRCLFMTQLVPLNTYHLRRELRTLVYSAVTDSFVR